MNRNKIIALIGLAIAALGIAIAINFSQPKIPVALQNQQLIVSAAASLKDSLTEITRLYNQANPNISIQNNFASSGALQQQIENGAPVDIFFAAATKQMDGLESKNLILTDTRRNLLSNRLVLIIPTNSQEIIRLDKARSNALLAYLKDIQRIAIADPRSVPVGQYAEQALKKLGIWEQIQSKLVLGNNVRQVLQFVESGNAQAGIVYVTDASISTKVKIVQMLDTNLYEPILYPIAVLQNSKNQAIAKAYLQFLASEPVTLIFKKYGFSTL